MQLRPELEGKVTEVAQILAGQWRAVAAIAAPVNPAGAETCCLQGAALDSMENAAENNVHDGEGGKANLEQDESPKLFLFSNDEALKVKQKCDQES